ncbi:MAG TPA: hypothetical protein VFR12_13800, partial [Pyrinomonadaceae bacterium]|nr:hypothetical protein [Pyrinomonadaceae bacterium]
MFLQLRLSLAFSLLFILGIPLSSSAQNGAGRETITIQTNEGTELSFDVSPGGRTIIFDLLGQLWIVPAHGGKARAITDAVRDKAEDLDPAFAPDGRRIVFTGERNGRTGLWLLNLEFGRLRQLTQLANPDGFDRDAEWSPDGSVIAFTHAVPPKEHGGKWRSAIMLLDVSSGAVRELSITGVSSTFLSDPAWLKNGKEIAFVARGAPNESRGRVWIVAATGGAASALTPESMRAEAPAFTADGRRMAYFAVDSNGRTQVWVQDRDGKGSPVRLTDHADVAPTRIRWLSDNDTLAYSADGRLWKLRTSKGKAREIPFTARLSFTRSRRTLPPARFPEPGQPQPARGFMGLALSPDGGQIGILALGKLWTIPVSGSPREVAKVPFEATSLAWSPDGSEVVWSAGVAEHEDLFATDVKSGATRRVTSLPGREAFATYSPDGRYLAFVHVKDDGVLRVVDAKAVNVTDVTQTRDLGSIGSNWTSPPQWSPASDGLLVSGEATPNQPGRATFVPLSGPRETITRFPDAPIFLQWTPQKKIVFVRHDR